MAKPEPAKPAVAATAMGVTQAPSAIKSAVLPPPAAPAAARPAVVTVAQPTAVQQAPAAIKSAIVTQSGQPGERVFAAGGDFDILRFMKRKGR